MKKLNVLLIVALLVTALMSATVSAKLVRLDVYNWTGENVYMRLTGVITGQFYYLTVPPTVRSTGFAAKSFTVLSDRYQMDTWACGGVESGRELRMLSNQRLVFTTCNILPTRRINQDLMPLHTGGDGIPDKAPNFGEPTMEKVVYFQSLTNRVWVKIGGFGIGTNNVWILAPTGGAFFGVSEPLLMHEFCSPNNCFYRVVLTPFFVGIAYGPAGSNGASLSARFLFRYRY
jgi:hypothetical protein